MLKIVKMKIIESTTIFKSVYFPLSFFLGEREKKHDILGQVLRLHVKKAKEKGNIL